MFWKVCVQMLDLCEERDLLQILKSFRKLAVYTLIERVRVKSQTSSLTSTFGDFKNIYKESVYNVHIYIVQHIYIEI